MHTLVLLMLPIAVALVCLGLLGIPPRWTTVCYALALALTFVVMILVLTGSATVMVR